MSVMYKQKTSNITRTITRIIILFRCWLNEGAVREQTTPLYTELKDFSSFSGLKCCKRELFNFYL